MRARGWWRVMMERATKQAETATMVEGVYILKCSLFLMFFPSRLTL